MKKLLFLITGCCLSLTGLRAQVAISDAYNDGSQTYDFSNPETVTNDPVTGVGYVAKSGGQFFHFGPATATLTVNGLYNAYNTNINGFVGTPTTPGIDYFQGLDGLKATAQEIAGNTVPIFGILNLDNGANLFNVTNTQGANVGLTANFTNGITTTVRSNTAAGALRFLSGAGYTGSVNNVLTAAGADGQHVNGYVGKIGNQTFIYPVGSGTDARPLQISAPSAATDEYDVAWIVGDPTTTADPSDPSASQLHPITSVGTGLSAVSPVGQWDWIAVSGTGVGLTITVSIPAGLTGFAPATGLRLVGWNGTQWVNLSGATGSASASGNAENNTLVGVMQAGITAIGIGSAATTPILNPDFNVTLVNVPVPGNVRTNDVVPPGTTYGPPTASPGNPPGGTITLTPTGSYTFTSTTPGTFTYTVPVCPPGQTTGCPTTPLVITVLSSTPGTINPPVANPDYASTNVNTPVTVNVRGNDTPGNPGGVLGPLTIVTPPANGTATIDGSGNIVYTPAPGYVGDDILTYQVCESPSGLCRTTTETIHVLAPGSSTVTAVDDYNQTPLNTPVSGNVLTNDIGTGLTVSNAGTITAPGVGTLVLGTDGAYTYTPATGVSGPVNFTYTACDGASNCSTATLYILVKPGVCIAPLLTAGSAVCNGATYSVTFSGANGATITASVGTVSGNTVTGITAGSSVTITATNGCGTSSISVTGPANCTTPPTGCTQPSLSAGQGVCNGSGTYSVAFAVNTGATITASVGTVSGNTVTGIPVGTNLTITATSGACSAAVSVNSPADCSTPCATPGVSIGGPVCNGTTYSVTFSNPNGATITASAGTVGANSITGIALGTAVTITATASGCADQVITIAAPTNCVSCIAPLLTAGNTICNGATYSVSFAGANGATVTASSGTISGNTVSGITAGSSVTLTATNGCGTSTVVVTGPANCTNPPTGCTQPNLSAGQGVCNGSGTYSVAFAVNTGATITASVGTVSGNTVTGIPVGTNVMITATSGACSAAVSVNSPADCSTPCATPGVSIGGPVCNGTTYSVTFSNPNGATISASAGTVGANSITGIALNTAVTITATASGCTAQVITIAAPTNCVPDLVPVIYARPSTVYNTTPVTVVVDVAEVAGVASSGLITVRVTKTNYVALTYNPAATSIGGRAVQNSIWTLDNSNSSFYILTTTQSVGAKNKLSFGFTGTLTPGATTGTLTVTSAIVGGSGGELRTNNNADADKIDFFQQ